MLIAEDAEENRYIPRCLTASGHDFANSVRDAILWRQTLDEAKKITGGAALDVLKKLADGFVRKKLGDLTGIVL